CFSACPDESLLIGALPAPLSCCPDLGPGRGPGFGPGFGLAPLSPAGAESAFPGFGPGLGARSDGFGAGRADAAPLPESERVSVASCLLAELSAPASAPPASAPPALPPDGADSVEPYASRKRRATGASTVEDADFT